MTKLTRRALLKAGAHATAGTVALGLMPRPLLADLGGPAPVPVPPIQDPDVKQLALRAIEASRTAGAAYADVRLTHTRRRMVYHQDVDTPVRDREIMHAGVRALADGYWGFASSMIWSLDEMARLG